MRNRKKKLVELVNTNIFIVLKKDVLYSPRVFNRNSEKVISISLILLK